MHDEDFVPFELEKRLRSKGFQSRGKEVTYEDRSVYCPSATISKVLKWLRKEKCISVEPYSSACGWRVTICRAYHPERTDAGGGTCLKREVVGYNDGGAYEKFEEAAIAGIKFTVDNLI